MGLVKRPVYRNTKSSKSYSRAAKKIMISASVLFTCFVIAGLLYVYLTDRNTKQHITKLSSNIVTKSPLPTPLAPGPNSPEGVSIEVLASPASIGSDVYLSVLTNAGSTCSVAMSYNGGQTGTAVASDQIANDYGDITWNWTVGSNVPVGTWPVKVVCAYRGRTGVAINNLQVISSN
jgi:hypothetical protein